jgi:hypothetical protein
MFWR